MNVRQATLADANAISNFWTPQILETVVTFNSIPKTPDDLAHMIQTRPCFLVWEAEGAVQGFVTYDQFRGGIGYARTMEHTIILAPQAHGKGVGRALMEAAFAQAQSDGVHSLWAGVSAENTNGVAFHKALGFAQVAILPEVGRKFDRWMDLVLMQKRL